MQFLGPFIPYLFLRLFRHACMSWQISLPASSTVQNRISPLPFRIKMLLESSTCRVRHVHCAFHLYARKDVFNKLVKLRQFSQSRKALENEIKNVKFDCVRAKGEEQYTDRYLKYCTCCSA